MARSLTQQFKAEPAHHIRPWGLSGFVGKLIVVEREHVTGALVDRNQPGVYKHAVDVATGVLESAHRTDRNGTSAPVTTLIFRGGGTFTFRAEDLVLIHDAEGAV